MIKRKIVEEINEYDAKGDLVRTTTTVTTEEDDSATSGYAHITIPYNGEIWKVRSEDLPCSAATSVQYNGGDTPAKDSEETEEAEVAEVAVTIEVDNGILMDLAREVANILRGGRDFDVYLM